MFTNVWNLLRRFPFIRGRLPLPAVQHSGGLCPDVGRKCGAEFPERSRTQEGSIAQQTYFPVNVVDFVLEVKYKAQLRKCKYGKKNKILIELNSGDYLIQSLPVSPNCWMSIFLLH